MSVYRDQIDHPMNVVKTYKEMLAVEPDYMEAVDALIEMYEKLNRASELIQMIQRKAELVRSDEERVAQFTRAARLYLEKFRNQPEAIKAYEQVVEIDPNNSEAIDFLKDMYEKRRDWEKAISIRRRAIDAATSDEEKLEGLQAVSYTHLTLPTICSV